MVRFYLQVFISTISYNCDNMTYSFLCQISGDVFDDSANPNWSIHYARFQIADNISKCSYEWLCLLEGLMQALNAFQSTSLHLNPMQPRTKKEQSKCTRKE